MRTSIRESLNFEWNDSQAFKILLVLAVRLAQMLDSYFYCGTYL